MVYVENLWGSGTSLTFFQMSLRGAVVFVIALILIRLSGRRSFGINSPLDNIIVILLGAVLSRAVVGASPFLAVLCTSTVIVLLHRLFSWFKIKNKYFSHLIDGNKIILFENAQFNQSNMKKALITEEDIMQELRKTALTDDLTKIKLIYMERSGELGIVKKNID